MKFRTVFRTSFSGSAEKNKSSSDVEEFSRRKYLTVALNLKLNLRLCWWQCREKKRPSTLSWVWVAGQLNFPLSRPSANLFHSLTIYLISTLILPPRDLSTNSQHHTQTHAHTYTDTHTYTNTQKGEERKRERGER